MATIVHGDLTVADVVVIVCYIFGAITVGVSVRQIFFLTYFLPMFLFYTSWKRQKTKGFLVFSGGINWNISKIWINLVSFRLNSLLKISQNLHLQYGQLQQRTRTVFGQFLCNDCSAKL